MTEPPANDPYQAEIPFRLHSFILKIWLEDTQGKDGSLVWRGHIRHVSSTAEQYVKSVEEIMQFIHAQIKD